MPNIIYDATRVKVCQGFYDICEYAQRPLDWSDRLWADILSDAGVYGELVYYIEHHTFEDKVKVEGYGLSDLYVFQMDKYNLIREIGKNTVSCNKEKMVMRAFRTLIDMKRDPQEYLKRLREGRGEDRL